MSILDKLPLATIASLAAIVIVVYAYVTNDINLESALQDLGAAVGGIGIWGVARSMAGKGVRGD